MLKREKENFSHWVLDLKLFYKRIIVENSFTKELRKNAYLSMESHQLEFEKPVGRTVSRSSLVKLFWGVHLGPASPINKKSYMVVRKWLIKRAKKHLFKDNPNTMQSFFVDDLMTSIYPEGRNTFCGSFCQHY